MLLYFEINCFTEMWFSVLVRVLNYSLREIYLLFFDKLLTLVLLFQHCVLKIIRDTLHCAIIGTFQCVLLAV